MIKSLSSASKIEQCERIDLVTLYKRATVSKLLSLLGKKEQHQ